MVSVFRTFCAFARADYSTKSVEVLHARNWCDKIRRTRLWRMRARNWYDKIRKTRLLNVA